MPKKGTCYLEELYFTHRRVSAAHFPHSDLLHLWQLTAVRFVLNSLFNGQYFVMLL